MVKIEKWVKRKFHKAVYFMIDLRNCGWAEARFDQLLKRLSDWAVQRPWREEKQLFCEEHSARGTSTPFSHYSSFDSLHTVESVEPKNPADKQFFMSGKPKKEQTIHRLDLTGHKSKSYFSKSLSVLEKAHRAFKEAANDESRLSRKRDVRLTDVNPRVSSGLRDVLSWLIQRYRSETSKAACSTSRE